MGTVTAGMAPVAGVLVELSLLGVEPDARGRLRLFAVVARDHLRDCLVLRSLPPGTRLHTHRPAAGLDQAVVLAELEPDDRLAIVRALWGPPPAAELAVALRPGERLRVSGLRLA